MRDTPYDGLMLGLWLDHHHGRDVKDGGFDGFYTYVNMLFLLILIILDIGYWIC